MNHIAIIGLILSVVLSALPSPAGEAPAAKADPAQTKADKPAWEKRLEEQGWRLEGICKASTTSPPSRTYKKKIVVEVDGEKTTCEGELDVELRDVTDPAGDIQHPISWEACFDKDSDGHVPRWAVEIAVEDFGPIVPGLRGLVRDAKYVAGHPARSVRRAENREYKIEINAALPTNSAANVILRIEKKEKKP